MKILSSSNFLFAFSPSGRRLFSFASLVTSLPLAVCGMFFGLLRRWKNGRERGLTKIIHISVNDSFVINESSKTYINSRNIKFLEDVYAKYTYEVDLELDLLEKGLGIRYQRFPLVCNNLEVTVTNIEEGESW